VAKISQKSKPAKGAAKKAESRPTASSIEPWEAALIRAMQAEKYGQDKIISYFTRPDRGVNPYRLAEIKSDKLHKGVPAASAEQLAVYIKTYRDRAEAQQRFFDESPLHPVNLAALFRVKEGTTSTLHASETDQIECRESFNWGNKADYARVLASFANARGGFLVFGVRDGDKEIVGIPAGKIVGRDPAEISAYLLSHLSPSLIWEKGEMQIAGKTIGLMHVRRSDTRPVVCTANEGRDLREADIYYRYPGQTRRIRQPEIAAMFAEHAMKSQQAWAETLGRIQRAGVENIAILNAKSGLVEGAGGKFIIDESLIPKIKFVTEGKFSESEGAPTLRLIGQIESAAVKGDGSQTVREPHNLTDDDLIRDFIHQTVTADPKLYVERLALSQKTWLPVFYFMRKGGLSLSEALAVVRSVPTLTPKRKKNLAERLTLGRPPTGAPGGEAVRQTYSNLKSKEVAVPSDDASAIALLKAKRSLKEGEIDPPFLFPLLKRCLETGLGTSGDYMRNAVANVDAVWNKKIQNEAP
jgi:hypothetical protein